MREERQKMILELILTQPVETQQQLMELLRQRGFHCTQATLSRDCLLYTSFAQILRDNGTEVVYLEDLMTDVLNLHPELVEPFLYQWLSEGNIKTKRWQDKLYDYLINNFKGKALVEKTMEGITLKEMGGASAYSLQDLIAPADDLIVDPMPNLYFTRDPFASRCV